MLGFIKQQNSTPLFLAEEKGIKEKINIITKIMG